MKRNPVSKLFAKPLNLSLNQKPDQWDVMQRLPSL